MSHTPVRCHWAGNDPLYQQYHDKEWGIPVHDEHMLFEMLTLEGAQAGLSWITILRKRARYREVFEGFEPERVARFGKRQLNALLKDPGIVRNRLKLTSTIDNARAFVALQDKHGSADAFLWRFVSGQPIINHWCNQAEVPASSPVSETMSRALKQAGFRFVGPTICYAFMQAVGMVNDHTIDCFRHRPLAKRR